MANVTIRVSGLGPLADRVIRARQSLDFRQTILMIANQARGDFFAGAVRNTPSKRFPRPKDATRPDLIRRRSGNLLASYRGRVVSTRFDRNYTNSVMSFEMRWGGSKAPYASYANEEGHSAGYAQDSAAEGLRLFRSFARAEERAGIRRALRRSRDPGI